MRTKTMLAVAVAVLLVAGCGSSGRALDNSAGSARAGAGASAVSGTISVFAAASLQDSFTALAKQFQAAHPGVTVKLNFGASSALALQINQGAPADVFASASVKNMSQVSSAGGAGKATNFVKNIMEIAVPPANPAHIGALSDLARSGVKVALCQPQVPCGAAAQAVLGNAKLTVRPVTLEADVKSTLSKVELDEVDAGVVYVTDVLAAGSKVKGIAILPDVNASTEYPIAALNRAANPAGARAFTQFVLSSQSQSVLLTAGFQKP